MDKIFKNHITDKILLSRLCKETQNTVIKKFKMGKYSSLKEAIQMTTKHKKRHSMSSIIREIKFKTIKNHQTPVRTSKIN